jgi:hypothetical protein
MMWGSASADRSIIASGSPPRTPSPAFGLGPRSFRARRRGSSEPRRQVPAPPEPPDPTEWTPAIEAGPPVFGPADPPRRDLGRRGSSEPERPGLGGSSEPPRPVPGTRRRCSSERRPPPSPRLRIPGSSESVRPLPARQNLPLHRGRPAVLRNREPTSRDPGDGALRSPVFRSPDPAPPGSSEPGCLVRSDRPHALRGAVAPPQAGSSVVRPPRQRGSRSVTDSGFGRCPKPGRTVTTGRQRPQ